jgi:zinc protease
MKPTDRIADHAAPDAARNRRTPMPDDDALHRLAASAGPAGSLTFVERHPFGAATQVERFRLSNGLTLLLSVDPSAPVVAYQTWFRVGSRHERVGKTGIAHLFEHMMFKATKSLPEGEFDRLMEQAGVNTNASTWLDWTYYRENLPAQALPLVVRLEADRMTNLLINTEQLESEREVVVNERHLRVENDPEGRMYEELFRAAFPTHPYGWPTIGWMDDIKGLTLADCQEFYRLNYAPDNATLVVVGDVDRGELLRLVVEHYGHLVAQSVPRTDPPPEPDQDGERRVELRLPLSAPKVILGFRSPAMGHPDIPALEVVNELLFNSESARLYKRLVTDDELVSSVSGWVSSFALPGLYEVFASLKENVTPAQLDAVLAEEFGRLAAEGPSEREIEKARNKLEADLIRGLLSVGARGRVLGTYETTAGDYKAFFAVVESYRRVTAEDVRRAAQTWLRPETRTTVVALPSGAPAGAAPDDGSDDAAAGSDEE